MAVMAIPCEIVLGSVYLIAPRSYTIPPDLKGFDMLLEKDHFRIEMTSKFFDPWNSTRSRSSFAVPFFMPV